jgi:hypothetical protein
MTPQRRPDRTTLTVDNGWANGLVGQCSQANAVFSVRRHSVATSRLGVMWQRENAEFASTERVVQALGSLSGVRPGRLLTHQGLPEGWRRRETTAVDQFHGVTLCSYCWYALDADMHLVGCRVPSG